jgi:hypothetical protein
MTPPALGLVPGGFVHGPSELCQLALTAWELGRQAITPDWVAEEKHDGIRLLWIGGQMVTREGEPFEAAEHLRPTFERLERRAGKRMFFDCEFVAPGGFLATLRAFRRGSDNREGRAMLFDGFPLDQWRQGMGVMSLGVRRRILEAIYDDWKPEGVPLVEQTALWHPAAPPGRYAEELARLVWERDGEGLMLKDTRAPYVRGRTASWLKVKRSLKLTARVLEVLHAGASLKVQIEDRKLKVSVPPGKRSGLGPWIVGKDVEVTAMEWTAKGSLRQGVLHAYPSSPVQTGKEGE